jgi:hypothetical protein
MQTKCVKGTKGSAFGKIVVENSGNTVRSFQKRQKMAEPFGLRCVHAPRPKEKEATMRANDQMKNTQTGKMEGTGLPGPFGEIPKKLKEYYDSLQEEAIPDRFLDLLERLDMAEREAVGLSSAEELK